MALSKRLRYEVFRRDGNRCVYCGVTAKDGKLVIDHVVAIALGGTNDVGNLVTACVDCNAGKSSVTADEAFVAQVDSDTARFQRAMAAAVRIRRQATEDRVEELAEIDIAWNKWHYLDKDGKSTGETLPRPVNWSSTAEGLLVAGLPVDDMVRLVATAMQARTRENLEFSIWRYYVGCCKNVLAEIQGTARKLIEAQDAAREPKADSVEVEVEELSEIDDLAALDLCVECMKEPALDMGGWCRGCEDKIHAFHDEWDFREQERLARIDPATIRPSLSDLP